VKVSTPLTRSTTCAFSRWHTWQRSRVNRGAIDLGIGAALGRLEAALQLLEPTAHPNVPTENQGREDEQAEEFGCSVAAEQQAHAHGDHHTPHDDLDPRHGEHSAPHL